MKTQKGITLIALIITIIVMLILVGVSVSVALNTGLFKTAQGVAKNTEAERVNETTLSNGSVTVKVDGEDKTFESMDKYVESLKGGNSDENPLAALECGDYVSYEQAVGNGTASITTWRVLSNRNGTVTLISKLPGDSYSNYLSEGSSTFPSIVAVSGENSLISDVTLVPSFEALLEKTKGSNEYLQSGSIDSGEYKLFDEVYDVLVACGFSEEVLFINTIDLSVPDDCCAVHDVYFVPESSAVSVRMIPVVEAVVWTEIVGSAVVTGGTGESGSPYTLGK